MRARSTRATVSALQVVLYRTPDGAVSKATADRQRAESKKVFPLAERESRGSPGADVGGASPVPTYVMQEERPTRRQRLEAEAQLREALRPPLQVGRVRPAH